MHKKMEQRVSALLVGSSLALGASQASANAGQIYPPHFCVSQDGGNELDYASGTRAKATLPSGGKINCPLVTAAIQTLPRVQLTTSINAANVRLRIYDRWGDRVGNHVADGVSADSAKNMAWFEWLDISLASFEHGVLLFESTASALDVYGYGLTFDD